MGVLRLSLAVTVLLFHVGVGSSPYFRPINGESAVFCFFVISGFYMEMILAQKYTRERLGPNWVWLFYASRYLRLFPLYAIVALVVLFFGPQGSVAQMPAGFAAPGHAVTITVLRTALAAVANATLFLSNVPSVTDLWITAIWSLGVELSFYAVAPWLLRMRLGWLAAAAAIGASLQFLPYGQHAPVLFGAHFFILGALLSRYRGAITERGPFQRLWRGKWILYGLVLFLVFYSLPWDIALGPPQNHAYNFLDRTLYPLAIGLLLPFLHEATQNSGTDFFIGKLSYPFYLLQQFLVDVSAGWTSAYKTWTLVLTCVLASVVLSEIERLAIEPWRQRLGEGRKRPARGAGGKPAGSE